MGHGGQISRSALRMSENESTERFTTETIATLYAQLSAADSISAQRRRSRSQSRGAQAERRRALPWRSPYPDGRQPARGAQGIPSTPKRYRNRIFGKLYELVSSRRTQNFNHARLPQRCHELLMSNQCEQAFRKDNRCDKLPHRQPPCPLFSLSIIDAYGKNRGRGGVKIRPSPT